MQHWRMQLIAALFALVIGLSAPTLLAQRAWRPPYPPTTQQTRRFEAIEAQATGLSVNEFRKFWGHILDNDHILIGDIKTNLVDWYQSNPDGSVQFFEIMPKPSETEKRASISYNTGDAQTPPSVVYSAALPINQKDTRAVMWIDLNADGVFDELMIPTKHNDLLKLDQGVYILIAGKWKKATAQFDHPTTQKTQGARRHPIQPKDFKVNDVTYHFDSHSGRWRVKSK